MHLLHAALHSDILGQVMPPLARLLVADVLCCALESVCTIGPLPSVRLMHVAALTRPHGAAAHRVHHTIHGADHVQGPLALLVRRLLDPIVHLVGPRLVHEGPVVQLALAHAPIEHVRFALRERLASVARLQRQIAVAVLRRQMLLPQPVVGLLQILPVLASERIHRMPAGLRQNLDLLVHGRHQLRSREVGFVGGQLAGRVEPGHVGDDLLGFLPAMQNPFFAISVGFDVYNVVGRWTIHKAFRLHAGSHAADALHVKVNGVSGARVYGPLAGRSGGPRVRFRRRHPRLASAGLGRDRALREPLR
mmetsp:Transcript_15840/g.26750  ORF Transcript_15840/g.26750 Transcript_15840/m.26750 type:complete len:306 (-) Transcript_15840:477-1394(-)